MRFFNRVSLSTPESVELDFTLAGLGNRTYALLIDYHILLAILVGFWVLWSIFSIGLLSVLSSTNANYSAAPIWLAAIFILLNFAIYTGYFIAFEVAWRGQTPGKRIAHIRVIQDDGKPIRLPQATLRSLLRSIDDLLFIGFFLILFGKREKRIGDWVAGTLVVQENRPDRKAVLVISDAAKELAAKLPDMSDMNQLLPDDFAILREYLQRRNGMASNARTELSLQLAQQLRGLIALESVPPNTTSDQFLEAVYIAYQQQATQQRRPAQFPTTYDDA